MRAKDEPAGKQPAEQAAAGAPCLALVQRPEMAVIERHLGVELVWDMARGVAAAAAAVGEKKAVDDPDIAYTAGNPVVLAYAATAAAAGSAD